MNIQYNINNFNKNIRRSTLSLSVELQCTIMSTIGALMRGSQIFLYE